jgi:hypothetical protein
MQKAKGTAERGTKRGTTRSSDTTASLSDLGISGQVNAAGRPYAAPNVRYWGKSGQRSFLAHDGLSAYDPTATLAVHCGNGFDAGFSPYRSTRLSR